MARRAGPGTSGSDALWPGVHSPSILPARAAPRELPGPGMPVSPEGSSSLTPGRSGP